MAWSVRVERDSLSPDGGRLTTVVACVPAVIWPQILTHRAFSRNAQSNRAVPTAKLVEQVRADPFVPAAFRANRKGMEPGEPLGCLDMLAAKEAWAAARVEACRAAEKLAAAGVHKQWANRPLAPFQWLHVVITATEWDGFFRQRIHEAAQDETYDFAVMVRDAMQASTPAPVPWDGWHRPFVPAAEAAALGPADANAVAVARCARVSYTTHDGRHDAAADLDLYRRLRDADPWHASAFEHVASPCDRRVDGANYRGWLSLRRAVELNKGWEGVA